MIFFSKIKQDLEHGGIKVTIRAAQSVSLKDSILPVSLYITNGAKVAQTIKKVLVEVDARENNSGFGMALNNSVQMRNTTNNNEMYNMQTIIIAQTTSSGEFVLQPNENKTITLNIVVNNPSEPKGSIAGNIEGITHDVSHYKYELQVKLDVEGIDNSPHTHQALQIS